MIKIFKLSFVFSILLFVITCKEAYDPPAIANAPNYLVVEGFINLNATTNIRLTRSTNLKDSSRPFPESNAVLMVEDDQNRSFSLSELIDGNYTLPASGLNPNRKYRLRIKTASSSEYLSNFVSALKTPEIDSISYKVQNNGVQFYANTHDDVNKYYRWDFEETYIYTALYSTFVQYKNQGLEPIFTDPIFRCFKTDLSNEIFLGSSANLSSNVITNSPVSFIPGSSGKLRFGYSILLRQFAMDQEAYQYWLNLKKNTEELGSIFDPQPSIATGNIQCITNPDEPVIGYMGASTVTTKRLYVESRNFPITSPIYVGPPNVEACFEKEIKVEPVSTFNQRVIELFSSGEYLVIRANSDPRRGLIGYFYAFNNCVDCRFRGGKVEKPVFWP